MWVVKRAIRTVRTRDASKSKEAIWQSKDLAGALGMRNGMKLGIPTNKGSHGMDVLFRARTPFQAEAAQAQRCYLGPLTHRRFQQVVHWHALAETAPTFSRRSLSKKRPAWAKNSRLHGCQAKNTAALQEINPRCSADYTMASPYHLILAFG